MKQGILLFLLLLSALEEVLGLPVVIDLTLDLLAPVALDSPVEVVVLAL